MIEETQEVTTVSTSRPEEKQVKTEHPQRVFEKKKAIFRTYQVVWYILAVVEVLLAFRVALKALGANPLSGFTSLVYAASNPFALPFSGILQVSVYGASVIEWSTLIAALVYAIIAYGLVYLMQIVKPVMPDEVEQKVDNP